MRISIGRALLALPTSVLCAQEESTSSEERRRNRAQATDTTLVTATYSEQSWIDAPFATSVVDEREIQRRFARTAPQILSGVPGISVQETAYGQGSPYLRGFTGYETLMLIDGVRLNNSVFRSGPNQYWSTVDPLSIERVEVVRGPSSVLYGSDALGGTVQAFTRRPHGWGEGFQNHGSVYYRIGSADQSHVGRVEFTGTWDRDWGVLLGGSGKRFDDLSGGEDIGLQENSGYDEWDGDLKAEHFLDPDTRLVFAHQRVKQDDAPRTHRTVFAESFEGTTVGTDLRHDFDQDRALTYVQLHGEDGGGALDAFHASLSWHDQEEVLKRVSGGGSATEQGFEVGTLGLFAWLGSDSPIGRLTYGADWYHDDVNSFSSTNAVQGPVADDATYDLLGAFVQSEFDAGERTTFTVGGRFNHAAVDANSVFDPVSASEISLEDDWSAFAGSARFLYRLQEEALHLFGGVSQGFRAPNLSDLTRFDSARSNEFEIPSPGLDPEHTTSYELGLKSQRETFSSQASVFYTDVRDLILRRPTGNVTGSGQFEVVKENVGDGHVWGIEAEAAVAVGRGWTVFGSATFVEGKVETFPTAAPVTEEEYLDKLMPLTAQLGARWEEESRWFELLAQGAGDADKLSTADTLDTQRIPPGGTPGYVVLHARGGLRLTQHLLLDVGLENLLDEDYRIHGSGLNRAGRSLIVALTLGY